MSEPERVDAFAGDVDLSDFKPNPPPRPAAEKTAIPQASEAHNFPGRAPEYRPEPEARPAQRRRRTGRNVQFNIRATAETIARFTALADRRGVPFGELLEQLVATAEG